MKKNLFFGMLLLALVCVPLQAQVISSRVGVECVPLNRVRVDDHQRELGWLALAGDLKYQLDSDMVFVAKGRLDVTPSNQRVPQSFLSLGMEKNVGVFTFAAEYTIGGQAGRHQRDHYEASFAQCKVGVYINLK